MNEFEKGLRQAVGQIADGLRPPESAASDQHGIYVDSLTAAAFSNSNAIYEVANALNRIADALETK